MKTTEDGLKNKNLVPYLIPAPDRSIASAGVAVLYRLAELLGPLAMINQLPPEDGRFIAIMPRIYPGNPFNAPLVVRYIMSNLDLYPAPAPRRPELIFTYSDSFRPDLKPLGKLFIPIYDLDLFENSKPQKRKGFCYYHGKGGTKSNPPAGAKIITGTWPPTRPELAQLLKTSEALYCDDTLTALCYEAILCGCRVVCPDIQGTSEQGIEMMNREIDQQDAIDLRNNFIQLESEVPGQIENFIKITQQAYMEIEI